ncbi:MAG: hypothetical protein APR53_03485 [Methanoculleus sp. SDB]|nr:MAG: hypothetical protein APR53_03485 [Methanoculleus sp. SDB]
MITLSHLTKIFRNRTDVVAVDDVSTVVKAGEIFGLLGPNGAGKTTVIRMLTTLMRPTSGTAFVGEYEITRDPEAIRGIIGVCPQQGTLDPDLTARENLNFYGKLLDMSDAERKERIPELLRMVGLSGRANTPAGTFSGGMKRKLEIVRAFIHHPRILFLDEPTIGLDPDSRRDIWTHIRTLNRKGTTVILTTHYMDEAEHLCDRIAFMVDGKLVAVDTLENLKQAMPGGDLIEIGTDGVASAVADDLSRLENVIRVQEADGKLRISAHNGSRTLPSIVSLLEHRGAVITSITIRSPSLEDIFIHITGANLDARGGGAA